MKKLRFLSTLVLAVMMMPVMVSCGDDDDDNGSVTVRKQLVGLWESSVLSYIRLDDNGYVFRGDKPEYVDRVVEKGTKGGENYQIVKGYKTVPDAHWSYDEKQHIISIYTDSYYSSYTFVVNMSKDGNSWAGYDASNGRTYSFIRVQNVTNPIVQTDPVPSIPIQIGTPVITNVQYTSVEVSVTVNGDGIIERGILYSTTKNFDVQTASKIISPTNDFKVTLAGLEEGTTYYVKAFALTFSEAFYSSEQSFTTLKRENAAKLVGDISLLTK